MGASIAASRFAPLALGALLKGPLLAQSFPMKNAAFLLLLVCLSSASVAKATEFHVSGREIAGRLSVERGVASFDLLEGAKPLRFEAEVQRTKGGIVMSYEVTETRTRFRRGMTHLVFPDPSLDPWRPMTYVVHTFFPRKAKGVYEGQIKGRKLTLNSVPATERWSVLVVPGSVKRGEEGVLRALRARGLSARGLKIPTRNSIQENASLIADEIRTEVAKGKRVILFGVDSGATQVTAALALERAPSGSVIGVIALYLSAPADESESLEIKSTSGASPRILLRGSRSTDTKVTNAAFDALLGQLRPAPKQGQERTLKSN